MSDTVIKVENISKEYHLGTISHGTLYRDLQSWSARLLGKEDPNLIIASPGCRFKDGTFKALDGVSFEVKQGDVLGVIGRNGAGKSTLLKIISQVTSPTNGQIKINGRISSLLEVGTGFHPELTGRENIYLNGAILGMSKEEITRKFDAIVDFSEIEDFIDTPVKRYSSGMYVRLAFAVAANLEPEILIVDEVLAVGDIAFQKKCLGKMGEVSTKQGRTILFVSHNLQAVSELCNTAILLEEGKLSLRGKTEEAINKYVLMGSNNNMSERDLSDPHIRLTEISSEDSFFKWKRISILNSKGICTNNILFGEPFEIVVNGYASEECEHVLIGLALSNKKLGYVFATHQTSNGLSDVVPKGHAEYRIKINQNILAPDYYQIDIGATGTLKVKD
jgi:lipopolysaccharide transport system ATP-binding protein